jgi:site-specific DNA-adenine methylase
MARKNSFRFEIPTFQYVGGKAKAARLFVAHMPRSGAVWCEPFAGRGNVFFRARASGLHYQRWVLNDSTTAPFFRALLDPDIMGQIPRGITRELARALNRRALEGDPAAWLISCRTAFSGTPTRKGRSGDPSLRMYNRGGFARLKTTVRRARRLLKAEPPAEIHADDALEWIQKSRNGWFLYVDPPYLGCPRDLYPRCDGGDAWHRKMINLLLSAASRGAKWQLSGYRTECYVELLGEPSFTYNDHRLSGKRGGKAKRVVECVWQNYDD